MKGPDAFIQHLRTNRYHPRSDAHSNPLCVAILGDVIDRCDPLARKARAGELVAKLNHTVTVNYQRWKLDLALGPSAGAPVPPVGGALIRYEPPALVEVAVEAKRVMTEHGKARHNRLRDLRAFHHHAHVHNPKVGAVGSTTSPPTPSPSFATFRSGALRLKDRVSKPRACSWWTTTTSRRTPPARRARRSRRSPPW